MLLHVRQGIYVPGHILHWRNRRGDEVNYKENRKKIFAGLFPV